MATKLIATVELADNAGRLQFANKLQNLNLSRLKRQGEADDETSYWRMRDGRTLTTDDGFDASGRGRKNL
ncbi:hypothetical protein Sa4125_21920 [Aureimonas sp. SA4125]|uniref:hypothetical protein n=1 Tax=Aureimonas sp. SA4125 TaxID=2826993 RepID=UPI001CC3CDF5|nr:hypothetical protein [Aureimonas sp. SA4125]BDA84650.1 hypothetical protein Sa4125_21920 [Aureimonas sp. SA4125]